VNARLRAAREEIDFKELRHWEESASGVTRYPQEMTNELTL